MRLDFPISVLLPPPHPTSKYYQPHRSSGRDLKRRDIDQAVRGVHPGIGYQPVGQEGRWADSEGSLSLMVDGELNAEQRM